MDSLILLLLLCLGLLYSLWLRICRFRQILETESKTSPLSLAIQELVAMAGGVYLSLVMLVSFLRLEIPEKVLLHHVSIDPLALTAISLAIIQPIVLKFIK